MKLIKTQSFPNGNMNRWYCDGRNHYCYCGDLKVETVSCECFKPELKVDTVESSKDVRESDQFHFLPNESLD